MSIRPTSILRDKLNFNSLTPQDLHLSSRFSHFQLSWTWVSENKESEFLNGSWRQVRNCQIPLVQFKVFVDKKQTNWCWIKNAVVKKPKKGSFEMFLKWRHPLPNLHYGVNFIGRGRGGKFKVWFHGTKASEFIFGGFEYIFRCQSDTKTAKTLLAIWIL